ncbi:pentapeptide repeat-containing protein [Embleya sp. NPDC050154]|uniref:pentapeptide repeat-containing protein n=1 Tax=Embleya sp. NPDC050154 TaxID=3363988 RepID=UPI0037934470
MYLAALSPGTDVDCRGTAFDGPLLTGLLDALRDPATTHPRLGNADFQDTTFIADAGFANATFTAEARFNGATFSADAWFIDATFAGAARFDGAMFAGKACFSGATFATMARFPGATFDADALFIGTTFATAGRLGPLACRGLLELSSAVFGAPMTVEAAATSVRCVRTQWEATATLRLRYATVVLSNMVVTQPMAVAAHPAPFDFGGGAVGESGPTCDPGVRIASLRGVDAAHLVLTDTDLTGCVFTGAFHLDQLHLDGDTRFGAPPTGWRLRKGVPARLARRRTIAEEHHWRALSPGEPPPPRGWTPGPDHPHTALTRGPEDIGPVYRALRKASEDAKNEPDAADFYYGEMEMRRHDRKRPTGERALITAYWLLSGYGLRATRALTWLLFAMTTTVLAMILWGLPTSDPKPHTTGVLRPEQRVDLVTDNPGPVLTGAVHDRITAKRAEKATRIVLNSVVFRSSGQNLTTAGAYIEMTSRLLEPALLALAVLAIRGRIKR